MAHFIVYNTSDASRKSDVVLGGAGTLTLDTINTEQEGIIAGTVKSDQGGQLFVEQSFDNTNWDYTATYVVTGGTGAKISEAIIAPYARIRYTNGATPQTFLRIFCRSFGTKTG